MKQLDSAARWPENLDKTGWLAADVDRGEVMNVLTPAEVDRLVEMADLFEGQELSSVTPNECRDPAFSERLDAAVERMKTGPGFTIVSGLPMDRLTLEQAKRIYWIIGSHFGDACSQNLDGQMVGEVRVQPNKMNFRAYSAAGPIVMHSDKIDMLSLMAIRPALRGGETRIASSLAVRNTILREKPEVMAILEKGFRWHRGGQQADGEQPETEYRVPIFGEHEGVRSCVCGANTSVEHQKKFFADEFGEADEAALNYFFEVRHRPEFAYPLSFAVGEMVFLNNYELLHSRDDFENPEDPQKGRMLFRLWLSGRPWRPMRPDMVVIRNASGRQGMDPKPHLKVHEKA